MFNWNVGLALTFTITILCIVYFYQDGIQNKIENFKNSCIKQGLSLDAIDVYLINLDRNKERLEFFIEQYMMSDLRTKQFNRLTAVDGKKIDIKEYISPRAFTEIKGIEKTGYRTKHYQLTRGAIGCYLSHLMAYEIIAKAQNEFGLIFEDDVKIDNAFFTKLNKILPTIPNDWDILLLGCHCISCDRRLKGYYDTQRFFWLHSYIVKKESAGKMVTYLKNKMIEQQIDSELSEMVTEGIVRIYCLKEAICKQTGSFSTDIQMPLKVISGINPYTTV